MLKSRTTNMTEGDPTALLAIFALPMLIGNIFQQAYNLADSVIVGRFIGAGALAAVGATNAVSFLFFSLCNGIGSGGGIVTAQYFGAGDALKVRKAIANSAYIMFGAAVLMGAVAFALTEPVLRLTGTPADILPDAVTYMHMCCAGVPLVAVYNYASSMLRALGDSRTPLIFLGRVPAERGHGPRVRFRPGHGRVRRGTGHHAGPADRRGRLPGLRHQDQPLLPAEPGRHGF